MEQEYQGYGSYRGSRISEYIDDVEYPARKPELIEVARRNEAPGEVVEALSRLPERRYDSFDEVMAELAGPDHAATRDALGGDLGAGESGGAWTGDPGKANRREGASTGFGAGESGGAWTGDPGGTGGTGEDRWP